MPVTNLASNRIFGNRRNDLLLFSAKISVAFSSSGRFDVVGRTVLPQPRRKQRHHQRQEISHHPSSTPGEELRHRLTDPKVAEENQLHPKTFLRKRKERCKCCNHWDCLFFRCKRVFPNGFSDAFGVFFVISNKRWSTEARRRIVLITPLLVLALGHLTLLLGQSYCCLATSGYADLNSWSFGRVFEMKSHSFF